MISQQRVQYILSNANLIKNNPDLLKKHMWKTKPCTFGFDCKREPSQCGGAHFIEEYRPPMCIYLEICQNPSCDKFHPNRCSLEDYIKRNKIDTILLNKSYLDKCRKAREIMTNPELLREHLYRTRKCFNGLSCSNKEKCQGAHFLSEYRLPLCLKMEYCSDIKCQHFHEGKQEKEDYMASQGISFEYNTEEDYKKSLLKPLSTPLSLKKSRTYNTQLCNTQLCSFVKEDSPCKRNGCSFAHSIDDLILPQCEYKDSCTKENCKNYHPFDNKLEKAKSILKMDIPSYYLRQSYENSTYYMMLLDQILIIEEFQEELGIEFLTEEETERDQLEFESYICEDIDVRIDYPSISHIIKMENEGILEKTY